MGVPTSNFIRARIIANFSFVFSQKTFDSISNIGHLTCTWRIVNQAAGRVVLMGYRASSRPYQGCFMIRVSETRSGTEAREGE